MEMTYLINEPLTFKYGTQLREGTVLLFAGFYTSQKNMNSHNLMGELWGERWTDEGGVSK